MCKECGCKRRAEVADAEWAMLYPDTGLGGKTGKYKVKPLTPMRQYEEPNPDKVDAINVGFLNPAIFEKAKKKK